MNLKTTLAALLIALIGTGCGSTSGNVPKSRFLKTGETTPLEKEDDSRLDEPNRSHRADHYRTSKDRTITVRMRNALNDDPSLSPVADDISISTINGDITLRGSVPTEKDKTEIGVKAQEIAGTGNVINQLNVQGY